MKPQPKSKPLSGARALASAAIAAEYYTTTPETCEPVSRLRMHEERMQERIKSILETICVLEGRLEPVLQSVPSVEAGCDKELIGYSCELDAVFGRALDQIEGVGCILSRIHDRLCL